MQMDTSDGVENNVFDTVVIHDHYINYETCPAKASIDSAPAIINDYLLPSIVERRCTSEALQ